ncbi:phosphoenolpyruvate carboxylase, partial [Candidatus Daviesbacteria bacterium]|nr:phosphoenolpyruvate carboxylase [Candidatus Daviesbacteria bacterium]
MVSQHPDHASVPYWKVKSEEGRVKRGERNLAFISTAEETEELFLSFSDLGVSEYKWDWEGKLVDESVIERLLSQYFDYFKKNPLGQKKFLTFRLPNPWVETEFRFGRSLMNLISGAAMATSFKLPEDTPLFEVILPMTTKAQEMIAIHEAFIEIASLKHELFRMNKTPLKSIKVIPLFEDIRTIINSDKILKEYLTLFQKKFNRLPAYLRTYVARSDPALNSGLVPTVLAIKIALSRFRKFELQHNFKLFPIIGSASLPFRGGLTPLNVEEFASEYAGIRTALIQSAFRYDYPKKEVINGIKKLD